jgi:hypothetical protein
MHQIIVKCAKNSEKYAAKKCKHAKNAKMYKTQMRCEKCKNVQNANAMRKMNQNLYRIARLWKKNRILALFFFFIEFASHYHPCGGVYFHHQSPLAFQNKLPRQNVMKSRLCVLRP